jgi:uncharacterized membrane protein
MATRGPELRGRRNPTGGETDAAEPLPAAGAFLERHALPVVWALVALHVVLYGALGVVRYRAFRYVDFDLAIFSHALDQLLRGSLYESIGGMNWLGGHVALVLFLIAPLYAVFRHPVALLLLQSLALALGALPVFGLARRETGERRLAVGFAALYLLFPALGFLALSEFHPETLAVAPLLVAFLRLRQGRLLPALPWVAFALLAREDVALVVLGMALYTLALDRPRRPTAALALAGMAALSLLLSFAVIVPAFGSGATDYGSMYARWGGGARQVAAGLLLHPLQALGALFATPDNPLDTAFKHQYWVQLLAPLAFLPLAGPGPFLIALPVLFEHFLSSRLAQHTIRSQYTALVIPFVMAAAVVGFGNLTRRLAHGPRERRWIAPGLMGLVLVATMAGNLRFGPRANLPPPDAPAAPQVAPAPDYDRDLAPFRDRMIVRLPARGGVVAGFEFLSHLTRRRDLHAMHHLLAGHYTFSSRRYDVPTGVEGVLADLGAGSLLPYVNETTGRRWDELLRRNALHAAQAAGDLVLFLREPADTVELCRSGAFRPGRPRRITYDGQLLFLGSDADGDSATAGGLFAFHTYWRRVAPVDRMFLTEFLLVDPSSRPVAQVWRYLGYTLYPAADWPPDTTMRETYRLVVPPDLPPGRYALGMRLWQRAGGRQGYCAADDPGLAANEMFVEVGRFSITK